MIINLLNKIYPRLLDEFGKEDIERNTALILLVVRLVTEELDRKNGKTSD